MQKEEIKHDPIKTAQDQTEEKKNTIEEERNDQQTTQRKNVGKF